MDEKERILSEAKAEADKIADTADTSYKTTIDEANRFKQEAHDEADAYDRQVRQKAQEDATAIVEDANTRWRANHLQRTAAISEDGRRKRNHAARTGVCRWKPASARKRMRTASIIRRACRAGENAQRRGGCALKKRKRIGGSARQPADAGRKPAGQIRERDYPLISKIRFILSFHAIRSRRFCRRRANACAIR